MLKTFLKHHKSVSKAKPKIILCATMRSGSTMVCEDMRDTESMGTAKELFMHWQPERIKDVQNRLKRIHQDNTSRNGVFSVNVMSKYLPKVESCLKDIYDNNNTNAKLFQNFYYTYKDAVWVYLKRDNTVSQAVSRLIARQTGVFHNFDDGRHKKSREVLSEKGATDYNKGVQYNFLRLQNICNSIQQEQIIWEYFFQTHGIKPLRLTYEECVNEKTSYLNKMADLLQIKLEKKPQGRTIHKLANVKNQQFHDQYCQDLYEKSFAIK